MTARPVAARALAQRLHELHRAGQIQSWDDVTLLFRASTGFPAYEDAFEDAGIPFVTVAGQGFYNRPEIRDVLNLLRAVQGRMSAGEPEIVSAAEPGLVSAADEARLTAAATRALRFLAGITAGDGRIPLFNDAAFGIVAEPAGL